MPPSRKNKSQYLQNLTREVSFQRTLITSLQKINTKKLHKKYSQAQSLEKQNAEVLLQQNLQNLSSEET